MKRLSLTLLAALALTACVYIPMQGAVAGGSDVILFGADKVPGAVSSIANALVSNGQDREIARLKAEAVRSTAPAYYQNLWATAQIRAERKAAVDTVAGRIVRDKARYVAVEGDTGVPWQLIAAIHSLEASGSFSGVLHNGEQIVGTGKKTRLEPKGRGPFATWEDSAKDALKYDGLTAVTKWDIPAMLLMAERLNGMGYRNIGIDSIYLTSFTTLDRKGKFDADGHFDPLMVVRIKLASKQVGVIAILKGLQDRGELDVWHETLPPIVTGPEIVWNPGKSLVRVRDLQIFLNSPAHPVGIDGRAGNQTSDAMKATFGFRLKGDPR